MLGVVYDVRDREAPGASVEPRERGVFARGLGHEEHLHFAEGFSDLVHRGGVPGAIDQLDVARIR